MNVTINGQTYRVETPLDIYYLYFYVRHGMWYMLESMRLVA